MANPIKISSGGLMVVQVLFMVLLVGIAASYFGFMYISEKISSIILLFLAGFMGAEIGILKALKSGPVITESKIGTYVVGVILALIGVIAVAGLLDMSVPDPIAPVAGTLVMLGAVVALFLGLTKQKG
jgi:peptidoglycan/LPS O-acetylase OafA/YrhL